MFLSAKLHRPTLFSFLLGLLLFSQNYAYSAVENLSALIEQCAPEVSPITMRYLLKVESNFEPFSLNINSKPSGKSFLFNDAISAIAMANKLISQGISVDMGLGQVNSATMLRLGFTVGELYDPCLNITASATILKACYLRARGVYPAGQIALKHALSCYNTGHLQRGILNGYVDKLQKLALPSLQVVPELLASEMASEEGMENSQGSAVNKREGEADAFANDANNDAFSVKGK